MIKTKKTGSRTRRLLLLGATGAVGGGLLALALSARPTDPPVAPGAARAVHLPERALSPLERAAVARFAGARPKVRMPDGSTADPTHPEHALAIQVALYKGILVRDEEKRDPTFTLRAEAELERRRPVRAAISWEDESGNRELVFTVDDSVACGLAGEGAEERSMTLAEVAEHPCLDRENLWDPGTTLTLHLEPIADQDALWSELLRETKKRMAAEAYLARAEAGAEG